MHVSVNVQNEGYLKNAVIELVDANIKFKNNPDETSIKLSDLKQTDKGLSVEIPVIAKDDETCNLALLNMQSQIKLTGEYIDEQGNVTEIDITKEVKMAWSANELAKEDIFLTQEVITNKIYNINGDNKRVVQLLVKSKIENNKAPVESSIIEISNPQIEGITLIDVKVASYGTEATNGKNSLWTSTSAEGKTNIEILNNANNENIVSWKKNAEDIFVVTYIYEYSEEENVELSTFVSDVKNTVEVYGRTETALEKTNQLPLEVVEEKGNIVNLETSITEDIYKGKMYIGEDTTYQEKSILYVPYSEVANTITIEDLSDIALTAKEEGAEPNTVSEISTYYKTTKINKADAIKILGANVTITIYNAEDKTTPIQTIDLATEEIEEDYYTVSYNTGINKVSIIMSEAKAEGTIEIINEKAIKVTSEETDITNIVLSAAQLKTNKNLLVTDSITVNETTTNVNIVNSNVTYTANLLEPKTTFDISLDKELLSTQLENELLEMTVELIAQNESNKLFDSPAIGIELPSEIEEASIESITPVVGNEELELGAYDVVTNEAGKKVVVLSLTGKQTTYSSNTATVTIGLKVKTNEFISDRNVAINAICINGGETVNSTENIRLVAKTGLITKNTLTVGESTIQEVNNNNLNTSISESTNVTISSEIINNFEETISNVNIVGKIPDGTTLADGIACVTQGLVVSYSEEENAAINSNDWKTKVTAEEYAKMRSFKISVAEMPKGSLIDLSYDLNINLEGIESNTSLVNDLSINYEINGQAKQENIAFTLNVVEQGTIVPTNPQESDSAQEESMIAITPKTTTQTLHEGQIVTYEIKVTNTSAETLSNVTLDYAIPQGAVVTELTYAQGSEITFTDDETTTNKTWTIQNLNPNQTITKEVTLKIKQGATQIINVANLKDSQNNVIAEYQSEPVVVNAGDLTVRLSRRANMEIDLTEGSKITYVILVTNNTNSIINNLTVTSKVPESTYWVEDSEYSVNWNYDENSKNISRTIDSLKSGETRDVRFEVKVNSFNNSITTAKIDNSAIVSTVSGEKYETNVYSSNVLAPKWDIHMTAEHASQLNEGESVKYIIKVTNSGERSSAVHVIDVLPEEIQFRKLTYYTNENNKIEDTVTKKEIRVLYPVEEGETLTIIIEGVTYDLDASASSKEISNVAKIYLGSEEYLESETIVNTIVNDVQPQEPENPEEPTGPEQPENPENPQDPEQPEDPEDPEQPADPENPNEDKKYSISGLAWLDENKNGIRDNQEKIIQALKVILLDKNGNQIDTTVTSLTGTYKFDNLAQGQYLVVFDYDENKYAITKYQIQDASVEMNSDVISKQMNINNENIVAGVKDIKKVENQNISNIDIGLVENPEFDLSLNKYISKVVVSNSKETTTYEYDDTELAKVEIGAKQLAGTTLLVEYEIEVVNNGDVDGYVTDIVDYLPKELEFNSEMNTEWYLGTDKNLHYMALDPQAIEPGKTQSVKLVLTKTLKSDSTGTIENIAEIADGANLQGILDIDSKPNNKQDGEDDISKASLIVSIRTGSPIMYIGIVIGSMLILGLGIYIINKKVLRVKM